MPLVTQNVISAWYARDSWVYKNFAFIFQNPIWNKSVPSGFSLCPYFWLALFSMIVLRPLVYTFLVISFLGGFLRLGKLLTTTDSFFASFYNITNSKRGWSTFCGTILSTILLAIVAFVIVLIGAILNEYYHASILYAIIVPVALALGLGTVNTYADKHGEKDRCRVENYMRAGVISSVIGAFLLHKNYAIEAFFGFPWAIVKLIIEALSIVFSTVGHWLFVLFTGASATLTWIAGLFVIFSIVGYFIDRWYIKKLNKSTLAELNKPEALSRKRIRSRVSDAAYWLACNYDDVRGDTDDRATKWNKILLRLSTVMAWAESGNRSTTEIFQSFYKLAKEELEQDNKYREVRINSCKKFTKIVGIVFSPITWPLGQLWLFGNLLWQLGKARKQGVCPYLKFHDSETDGTK